MGVRRLLYSLALVAVCTAGRGAQAQPAPAGPGLGAVRDTVLIGAGARAQLQPNIVPGSEALWLLPPGLAPVRLTAEQYGLEAQSGVLTLRGVAVAPGTGLAAQYRTLPSLPVAARRVLTEEADSLGRRTVAEQRDTEIEPLFGGVRLERRGSISRGITAGSNRDVSVESGLRMELSGPITDDVAVQAVLTDANTPIQPEGTTQQLSDFDRVYVQFTAPAGTARLGDVDLAYTDAVFASLTRKIQGAAVEGAVPAGGAFAGGAIRAAGATTRGLFRSQDLAPLEGVQGPYRLRGQDGEEFVLVVPGSERVYLDGVLLDRGEAQDYVIDYATGELTFTPRHLITAERRLTVDFEYTTSRYTRTLLAADADAGFWRAAGGARGRLAVTVLQEADAAAFGDALGLTEADLDAIAAAGDDLVLVDGAERVPFDPESPFVLYTRRDTTLAGERYRIFVPATAAADSVFRVRFSRVADGAGQYRRAAQALNGILYEWVGPTGGDYVPFRLLPAPQTRRVVDVRGSVAPVPGLTLFGEGAGSLNDVNTLSALDDGDEGFAGVAGLRLQPTALLGGRVSADVVHRRQEAQFRAFDRTRPVEFNRRWNLGRSGADPAGVPLGVELRLDSLDEATTEGAARWARGETAQVEAEAGRLDLGERFDAWRGAFALALDGTGRGLPALDARLDAASSHDAGAGETGVFVRQWAGLRMPVLEGRLTPSLRYEEERRRQNVVGADSLARGSFAFRSVQPGLAWTSGPLTATGAVAYRWEEDLLDGRLAPSALATTLETTLGYRPTGSLTTEARLAYRTKEAEAPFEPMGQQDTESLAVRWTGRAAPLRRAVEVTTLYEALTERTPLLQETYLLVGSELGEYVWRDGEGEPRPGEPDGVAQVDEFFPETTPLEGTYARTFVPSDALFPTIGVSGQLRLRLDPGRLVGQADARPLARALRLVSARTTLDVREQSTDPEIRRVLLLRPSVLQQRAGRVVDGDTLPPATLTGRFRVAQDLTFFPLSTRYGLRVALAHLTSTNRLAAGLETRRLRTARADADAVLLGPLRARLIGTAGQNRVVSDVFASRTFDIGSVGVEPQLAWTPSAGASATVGVAYSQKTNRLAQPGEATGATLVRVPLDARVTLADRLSLQVRAERADVSVEGDGAGLTLFELTEGRGAGVSYLWGLTGQYL
ncbi:MAG: hypothetical protein R3181_11370, partial [Rubricoccaceae bacterium]|nr:hypothetical protein [Rubricoccaceae bacterium]